MAPTDGENDEIFTQFKDYTVDYEELNLFGRELWAIRFRNPNGSSINMVDFLFDHGSIYVGGDLGSATYWWGTRLEILFFENISLHYFHSKCVASELGKLPHDWSEDEAKKRFGEIIKDHNIEDSIEDLDPDLSCKFDWNIWLQDNGLENFGDNYIEYSEIGNVISHRTKLHWAIIQLCARAIRDGVSTVKVEECPGTT